MTLNSKVTNYQTYVNFNNMADWFIAIFLRMRVQITYTTKVVK